jgi:hypothetical protein
VYTIGKTLLKNPGSLILVMMEISGGTAASRVDESIQNRTSTELVVVEEGLGKELLGDMIRR